MTHHGLPIVLLGRSVMLARRCVAGIVRQAVVHPFTFDRLDASPGALWPRNPEESEPPRWQLGAIEPPAHRPKATRRDGHPAIRRPAVRVPSTPWETGS